ncbi:hypothetical protein [Lysobacter gummosus]|uniref:hypothetical protein n=1 Tax=Lysobacter gummosus TaxID=262324 RepID=UPI0036275EE7
MTHGAVRSHSNPISIRTANRGSPRRAAPPLFPYRIVSYPVKNVSPTVVARGAMQSRALRRLRVSVRACGIIARWTCAGFQEVFRRHRA